MARYLVGQSEWGSRSRTHQFTVYDLLANRRTVKIAAHADDVNSCCWADTTSGNVLVSASDDSFLKVWCVTYMSAIILSANALS
jgi:WD domain, G-beta repeat.